MKNKRQYLPKDFEPNEWELIHPFFEELKSRPINSKEEFKKWLLDRSELEAAISENAGWRYIRMTCDTTNEKLTDSFNYFLSEIQPKIAPYTNSLNEKALNSPYLEQINEAGFEILKKTLEKDFKIFREENIPLLTEIEQEAHTYGSISGAMTVEVEGKELTLQQAGDYLQSSDRQIREDVWRKISSRRYQDHQKLDELFDKLVKLRHQVALNADYGNYRDYMFTSLGRFEYTAEDCFAFHNAIAKEVVPIQKSLAEERKARLNVASLNPWDLQVNYYSSTPLKPFENGEELLEKTIECFYQIDKYLGDCLVKMKEMGHLDLVSRKGKAPGGYNYPLDETGVPFIFMNATSTLRDLVTMVHEGGHALHSFLTKDLELTVFKHPPSEVAELASMSMELISMEHWDVFFKNEKDLIRARREHLESIIQTLPWVSTIDKFQHWIYTNPGHTIDQRKKEWANIFTQFDNQVTSWDGLENYKEYVWQKQLHLYEVPFYYIEYGMAQLGAVAVWKNYKSNREEGYRKYVEALKLGYTAPIKEVYQTAGIKFDFSEEYIKELMDFLKEELKACQL